MSSSERRIDPRVNIRVPLRFRALNNPGSTEQTAESENISQRGMYFMTARSAESRDAGGSVAAHAARAGRKIVERCEVRGARGSCDAEFDAGRHAGDRAAHRAVRGEGFGAGTVGELGRTGFSLSGLLFDANRKSD